MIGQFQLLHQTLHVVEHFLQTLVGVGGLVNANNLYLVKLVQSVQSAHVFAIAAGFATEAG